VNPSTGLTSSPSFTFAFRRPVEASASPLETNGTHVIGERISTTLSYPFGGGGEQGGISHKILHCFKALLLSMCAAHAATIPVRRFRSGGLAIERRLYVLLVSCFTHPRCLLWRMDDAPPQRYGGGEGGGDGRGWRRSPRLGNTSTLKVRQPAVCCRTSVALSILPSEFRRGPPIC
jgi:hypothetical protein